ncbi:hypothetical protein Skr01_53400 [Sphaerisporangium krabiense]|uniref:Ferric siderophore reductase C-terminal domain-containing protein n=1 Tax=Sphaerisporangium krabiense TaxID=763782 RepID=A0A7W9DQJ4_9ACTN|nr:(2Fe-2S)-binding protein [Sphaerisporangium krabiense]MBB5627099.1 hypothetical protein [Sphaerisporangium krabiense]GII65255.1 hypothetical protein Skr01_53400 [Sphaerisporangium krabiense]
MTTTPPPDDPVPAGPGAVATALADLSAMGPYFAIETGPGRDDEILWRPLRDLPRDTEALRARVTDFERRLGTPESRVAASILFQGLAARLWSPVVGVAAGHGLIPEDAPDGLLWRPAATGPLPLWASPALRWAAVPGHPGPEDIGPSPAWTRRAAGLVYRAVVTETLEPLTRAMLGITKIAPALLWGNAAAALAGVLRTLPRGRPVLAAAAAGLAGEVLRLGVLAEAGRLARPRPGAYFYVRASCCLYYRVPGGGYCDDCALISSDDRTARWTRATAGSAS